MSKAVFIYRAAWVERYQVNKDYPGSQWYRVEYEIDQREDKQ